MNHMKKCVYCRTEDAAAWTGWVLRGFEQVLAGWCSACLTRFEARGEGSLRGFTGHIMIEAETLTDDEVGNLGRCST